MAVKTDITIKRGSTYQQNLEAEDSSGNPIDLDGWSLRFMVKRDIRDDDAAAVIDETLTASIPTTGGLASFIIQASLTKDFPVGQFIYAYQIIDGNGVVAETDAAQCTILADVIQGIS